MKKFLSYTWIFIVLLFMYLPILLLAVYSFTDSTMIGTIRHFSVQNYITLFEEEELRNMIIGTVILALGSAVIATILSSSFASSSNFPENTSV